MPRRGEAVSQEREFCAAVWDCERRANSVIQAIWIDARICVPQVKKKKGGVKKSRYRPGGAQRVLES